MMKEKRLSLCILTKDEESFFPNCLNDVKDAVGEILVADLGSSDRTRELASLGGATVYRPEWEDDFSKIRNFCMDRAAGKWVLFLQADEAISREQLKELNLLLQNPVAEGYLIHVDGGQEKQAVSSPAQSLRLIRNRKNYRFHYRSFEYISDEELYSVQDSGLRIAHRGEKDAGRLSEEKSRLLQMDLKEHPQDGYLRYMEGLELLNQEKYKESAASLELAYHAFGGGYLYSPHLYKCLGACLLSLGRNAAAEEVLNEGFWLFPFYTDLLVLRAELYGRIGRKEEALKDMETCLALLKSPNACVPKPEIDSSAAGEILEEIRAGLDGSPNG